MSFRPHVILQSSINFIISYLPRALVWRCAGATTVVLWAPARCPSCFRHCRSVLPSGPHSQKCCCDPSRRNGAPAPGTTLHGEVWKGWPPTRSMHLAGLTRASKWLALPWCFIMLWLLSVNCSVYEFQDCFSML